MSTFFEKLQPGMVSDLGSHTFGRDEIIAFAEQFDPQRFHLSEEGAKDSLFGALCASGWHTMSVFMRLNIDNGRTEIRRLTQHEGPIVFGPSPGVRNLKWSRPVYVGDTITYASTITATKRNAKREGWGLLMAACTGTNQDGQRVCSMDTAVTLRTD